MGRNNKGIKKESRGYSNRDKRYRKENREN